MANAPDFVTDADGMGYLKGARFVSKDEYLKNIPQDGLTLPVVATMLALAADSTGFIRDVQIDETFHDHIYTAMGADPEDFNGGITYNTFVFMAFKDCCWRLATTGYLAQRGNGDSYDYQLTLPPEA